jgi:hypothetical protein
VRDGRAEVAEVTIGHRNNRVAEVHSGLSVGDLIVCTLAIGSEMGSRWRRARRDEVSEATARAPSRCATGWQVQITGCVMCCALSTIPLF